jgi:hypothetical protein
MVNKEGHKCKALIQFFKLEASWLLRGYLRIASRAGSNAVMGNQLFHQARNLTIIAQYWLFRESVYKL